MTHRTEETFDHLGARRRTALVAYAVAGDPGPAMGTRVLVRLAQSADVLEIGVPCRDPARDGAAIRAGHARARAAGADWTTALDAARAVRAVAPDLPIILLLYAETVRDVGPGLFFQSAAGAGVDGLLVVDLAEKALPWWASMAAMAGLFLVPIVGPGDSDDALAGKLAGARGLVYCAGATTTGGAPPDAASVSIFLQRVQRLTNVARVLGFGIRTPEIAAQMAPYAEGLAVGTAFVETVGRAAAGGNDPAAAVAELAEKFSAGLREAG